nr:BlaI/MecI/CopY family transcriptional regulator [uncultured Schaedlerella sp.]
MGIYKITSRELEVLRVFWNSDESLTAIDIPKINPKLKINTVQGVIKNLLKKNYIEVDNIIYHNTVLTRTFKAVLTQEEYMMDHFGSGSLDMNTFVAALISNESDPETLKKLETMIQERLQSIQKESE